MIPASVSEIAALQLSTPQVIFPMTRKHFSRLRFFFAAPTRGQASHADGVDLELIGMGYIRRLDKGSGYVVFCITESGQLALAAERQAEIARRRPHRDLGERLAAWLRDNGRITWQNVEFVVKKTDARALAIALGLPARTGPEADLGPVEGYREFMSITRPDVFSMVTTTNEERMRSAIHEVKVSRADFLADIKNPEKRLAYACLAEVVYYACPEGVITVADLPAGFGLVVETESGVFKVLKRPRRRRVGLDSGQFMNLVLKKGEFRLAW